eukprot:5402508-Ditylum_brightwellii.AAC.1
MMELREYLSPWSDVAIVIYYRHFFSWIGSSYNQITKNSLRAGANFKNNQYMSLDQFVKVTMAKGTKFNRGISANVVKRAKDVFDNVLVMNMHDKSVGNTTESFYCDAVPNANHTCAAVRDKKDKGSAAESN